MLVASVVLNLRVHVVFMSPDEEIMKYTSAIGKSRDYLVNTRLGSLIYEKHPSTADRLVGELSECMAMLYMGVRPDMVAKIAHSRLQRYAPGDEELALMLNEGLDRMRETFKEKEIRNT